jgi:hypothetical protein
MLCPANILGYLRVIRLLLTGASCGIQQRPAPHREAALLNASSFRAECPALLPLREAPGHTAEKSLFDFTGGNISKPGESHVECGSSLPPFAVRACPDVLPEFR